MNTSSAQLTYSITSSDTVGIIAQDVIKEAQDKKIFNSSIKTKIVEAKKFYPAEDYHQKYLQKNPQGYNCHYQRPHWVF